MRRETELERWDRNFHELLQELRIAQSGAQIVLAFVLALAFTDRVHLATPLWRSAYIITLATAVAAMLLFLAPVSLHRMLFRRDRKSRIVLLAARLTHAGLGCVLAALAGAAFLVVHPMADAPVTAAFCCGTVLLGAYLWYLLPAYERRRTATTPERRPGS